MLRWVTYSLCKTTGHVITTPPPAPYLQRTRSLSIAGSFLPLWQPSNGPHFSLELYFSLLTQNIQNRKRKTNKQKKRNTFLTASCTCSVQFSCSVMSDSLLPLSITNSWSSLKLMSIESVLPSSHVGNNLVIALKVTYMLNHLQFYQNYFIFKVKY